MSRHIPEADLALYISKDLSSWKYVLVGLHTASCESCRARMEGYRAGRRDLQAKAAEIPAGEDWDRLGAEMTANIRVGLAAGECVAPRRSKPQVWGWKPVAIAAAAMVLLGSAFWLNLPASDAQFLAGRVKAIFQGSGTNRFRRVRGGEEHGAVVEASSDGIELRENGIPVSIPQAASRPLSITVSARGFASARYVDADTGQMTITGVYVQ